MGHGNVTPMKVLHIIIGLNAGGAELMLMRLINSHRGNPGFHHSVVSLTQVGRVGDQLREAGVDVRVLGMHSVLDIPRVLWQLVWIIRANCPDIVQTWMYHADLLGGLAARLAGRGCIVWGVRSTAIPQGMWSLTYWLVRLCAVGSYVIPHGIICCAKSAKEAHLKLGYMARKMSVIPNGYDFSQFDGQLHTRFKVRQELGFQPDEIVIGTVGRFDPLKDFHNFVAAASQLSAKRQNTKYLMVGRNIDWANPVLRGWIESEGLANKFRLVGEQSDVPYFLSALDIFCLSSANEAFPNVVVEAMAMGLPCVVTCAGDAAEILGDDDFVVPVKDAALLSKALLQMCDLGRDQRAKLGRLNAEKVRAGYGIESIRKQYEAAYDEIASK
jgi:glycosyltransferase involved in cell wall biosynthesis